MTTTCLIGVVVATVLAALGELAIAARYVRPRMDNGLSFEITRGRHPVVEAALAAANANVQRLQQLESFKRIVAPFSGVITQRNVDVGDLIDAGSTAAARAAVRSMQGEFSAQIQALQIQLTELRTLVEAAIDFPDEELDFVPGSVLGDRVVKIFSSFDVITASAQQGALLREGFNIVIAGKPNAGKSSLLNKLTGDEIAIVTEQPGTTRDVLRQEFNLDGLPVKLIDTAGLRATADVVEAEGVRRALTEAARADRVLYILDAAAGSAASGDGGNFPALTNELSELPRGVPVTLVFNKIDLTGAQPSVDETREPPQVFLSAKTGEGLDLLRAHLKARAGYRSGDAGALSARRRHLDALGRARACVMQAAESLSKTRAFELFAEDLRRAQLALGEITGEFTSDDLLGEIFGSFCIGK